MYGTQADKQRKKEYFAFENDVNMYGTQACGHGCDAAFWFENDVNMYGTQAKADAYAKIIRLRMM